MNEKEKCSFIYRIFIVILCAIALFSNFKLFTIRYGILYFTNLSNLLVFIYFVYILVMMVLKKIVYNDWYYILKGMVTMSITLTMIVYNFVLVDSSTVFNNHELECSLVHLIVPLMVIFDYFIFDEKGHLRDKHVLLWSLPLIFYQIFVTIYSLLGGRFLNGDIFPYFYMDFYKYGIFKVFFVSLIIFAMYLGFGFIVKFLDKNFFKK